MELEIFFTTFKFLFKKIIFNNIPFFFICLQKLDRNTETVDLHLLNSYCYMKNFCVETEIIEHLITSNNCLFLSEKQIFLIVYSCKTKFNNVFKSGIENFIAMNVYSSYTDDDVQYKIDQFFLNKLPNALEGKLLKHHIQIYLTNLREMLKFPNVENNKKVDENSISTKIDNLRKNLYLCTDDALETFYSAIETYTSNQLNKIVGVILENDISLQISTNVLNLQCSEPNQQKALSIKKTTISSSVSEIVDETINIFNTFPEVLKSGYYYIPENKFVVIEIIVTFEVLTNLICKNFVYAFKILSTHLDQFKMKIAIFYDLFEEFSKIRIKKKIIQFSISHDQLISGQIHFLKQFSKDVWQSGDDYIFNFHRFSIETLKDTGKRFFIYGVFSLNALKEISTEMIEIDITNNSKKKILCPFKIRRIVKKDELIFFYVELYIFIKYNNILYTVLPKLMEKQSYEISEKMTPNQIHWACRRQVHLIYHTYFQSFSESIAKDCKNEETIKIVRDSAIKNLIAFIFIYTTKRISVYPSNQKDACLLFDKIIRCHVNVFKEFSNPPYNLKFNYFNAKYDGPIISTVSVRTCEKMTNLDSLNKEYETTTSNVSALLNIPNYFGPQNENNAIFF